MSASSLVGPVKENAGMVDQGSDVDNTIADVMKPVTSIRLNDIDLDSDLVLSSDSDGLNGSELNVATTTEDEELRHIHPEIIELSVLRSSRSHTDRIHTGNRTHHHHHHHQQQHPPNLQENHDRIAQEGSSAAISVESEIDLENELVTNQQSSDLPSERMFRPSDLFMRSHTAASTAIETTADTEDDLRMSSNKRTVKTKKKKVRRSSASETDTVDTTSRIAANQRAHTGRRATRRALDARYRAIDGAESHIIFAPFPFAIISDNNRIGKDNEQLRRAIALNNVIVSDECDEDEGGVDDDNWNEKEIDEDDDQGDDESVASTCTSIPATQQISSNIHPSSISSSSSSVSMVTCRICFQPEQGDSILYRLVSPCLCEGTIKYLHQFCLNRWIAESGTPSCELCGYQFHLRTSSMRNVLHWRLIELSQWERVHLSLGFFSLLFVVISLSYMVWVTISSDPQAVNTRQSMTAEILFPIYACLDALTLCVCSYEMSSTVKRLWRRWRATNSCLIVLDKPVKRRRYNNLSVVLPEQDPNRPSSSTDATATGENLAECVIEHAEDDTDDVHDGANSSSTKLLISSPVRSAPCQTVPDDCSVTLSIANHDPLTSCSNLAIAEDDFSYDRMYVEHLNTETMV